jgi:hypothetical protein
MRFHSVEMLKEIPDIPKYYDLAIFASGFEKRSTYVATCVGNQRAISNVVLGFRDGSTLLSREENDEFFKSNFETQVEVPGLGEDEHCLSQRLDAILKLASGRSIRLLVDYSVMTRAWYGALLTWARFTKHTGPLEIDFVYAYGRYLGDFAALAISEIVSLPGFEGVSGGFRSTAAIFGLGYDKYATLAVYDRLEPDIVYCCVAQRLEVDPNANRVREENAVILDSAVKSFPLPLGDIPAAFRMLCEHASTLDQDYHIVLVPMGPKSHVLVSLLVALRMPWVTCLHAKGTRKVPVQVEALGELSVARVRFFPD